MMAVHQGNGAAWWKELSDFLHERTENQLRRLTIRILRGQVAIHATAPCERIRALAEAAAGEAVSADMLTVMIRVAGVDDKLANRISQPPPPPGRDLRPAPKLFAGADIHRQVQRLVSGN